MLQLGFVAIAGRTCADLRKVGSILYGKEVARKDMVGGDTRTVAIGARLSLEALPHAFVYIEWRGPALKTRFWAHRPSPPQLLRRPSRRLPGTTRRQIGRAHVCTPVTNAHLVCRILLK